MYIYNVICTFWFVTFQITLLQPVQSCLAKHSLWPRWLGSAALWSRSQADVTFLWKYLVKLFTRSIIIIDKIFDKVFNGLDVLHHCFWFLTSWACAEEWFLRLHLTEAAAWPLTFTSNYLAKSSFGYFHTICWHEPRGLWSMIVWSNRLAQLFTDLLI